MFEFLTWGNGNGASEAFDAPAGSVLVETPGAVSIKEAPIGEAPTVRAAGPTLGLALGGGAARGFAHIGVVRALVKKGLKFDVIAGTSIGAMVGGCHAAGQLDAVEDWARSLTRRRVLW